jgi:hypothetical protein
MRRIDYARNLLAAIALFGPLPAIHAQALASGVLTGVVHDPSGAVIPNVLITVTNGDQLNRLAAGRYSLEVRSRGFAIFLQKDIAIAAGGAAQFDPKLTLGSISETVEVVGPRSASAASPAPQGTPLRIRVGGNVQASKLLTKVNPVYPPDALRNGAQGTVVLKAVIGTDGHLLSRTPASSSPDPELRRREIFGETPAP